MWKHPIEYQARMMNLYLRSFPSWCHSHLGKCGGTGKCYTLIEISSWLLGRWYATVWCIVIFFFFFFPMMYFAGSDAKDWECPKPTSIREFMFWCLEPSHKNIYVFPPTVMPTDLTLASITQYSKRLQPQMVLNSTLSTPLA